MRTSGGVQVLVAVALLALSLSPVVLQVVPGDPSVDAQPTVEGEEGIEAMIGDPLRNERYFDSSSYREGSAMEQQGVEVVATLKENAQVPDRLREKYGDIRREGARRVSTTVSLASIQEFSSAPSVEAVYVRDRPEVDDRTVADGVSKTGIDALHEQGLTGDDVTVGVIGSGFRMNHPSIADQVRMYQLFSEAGPPVHGTAVASVVADTAPDSKLHLAAIGPETNAEEYEEAVDWLVRSDVDVIVDSGSYFGQPGDGTGPIAEVASSVPENVTFVTSAGNYAQRHWSGIDRTPDGEGPLAFEGTRTKNYLADGETVSGRISLGLEWSGPVDYDLYLYRETPAGDWLWQSSETVGNSESISINARPGRYYVRVERNGSALDPDPVRVSLFSNRRFQFRTESGSLTAPATAPDVVAVGAADGLEVASFSSRGAAGSGADGVDLVAPDDARVRGATVGNGTSFAAPYVAGTIALLRGEYPELSPTEAVTVIRESAVDIGPEGPDPASGYGLLDAEAAAEWARELVRQQRRANDDS